MSLLEQARNNLYKPLRASGSKEVRNQAQPSAGNRQTQPTTSTRRYASWLAKPKVVPKQETKPISDISSPPVPNSLFFAQDIQLAASVVIIQPNTARYVLLSEKRRSVIKGKEHEFEYWFLPRGRKDVGESLEQTAVREGHEESGYRCTLMPLDIPTRATRPMNAEKKATRSRYPNCEPIYIQIMHNPPPPQSALQPQDRHRNGTEYICFYYVAEIPEDAVPEEGTKMWDEQGYVTHLLSLEEALDKLHRFGETEQYFVVRLAAEIWADTEAYKRERIEKEREKERVRAENGETSANASGNLERALSRRKRKASEKDKRRSEVISVGTPIMN